MLDYEFDQFSAKRDRVDILAMDADGRVVVVELKREKHGAHADLQALRYAAKLRGVSFQDIVRIHRRALQHARPQAEIDGAERALLDHLDASDPLKVELEPDPRIVLVSPGFSKDLTTTVIFLRDHGIDVRCVRLTAYDQGNDRVILVPDVILPVREIEEYMARVELRDDQPAPARRETDRRPNVVPYLVKHGLLRDGNEVLFKHNLPSGVTFDSTNPDFRAVVVAPEDKTPKLRWRADNQLYSASRLATEVFQKHCPGRTFPAIAGPAHWGTEVRPLYLIAQEHQDAPNDGSAEADL